MNYGFIYCLGNQAMPGIYKIGMTDRAPAQRCLELSSSTSTPMPFSVLCFGQVEDARSVEADLHSYFKDSRVNHSREFFRASFAAIHQMIAEYSDPIAMTSDGEVELERQSRHAAFLEAISHQARIEALVSAARFEGAALWREGTTLMCRGALNQESWIHAAVFLLRDDLLAVVPDKDPVQSRLSKFMKPTAPEVEVLEEELDW